jgi:hypothetical protein
MRKLSPAFAAPAERLMVSPSTVCGSAAAAKTVDVVRQAGQRVVAAAVGGQPVVARRQAGRVATATPITAVPPLSGLFGYSTCAAGAVKKFRRARRSGPGRGGAGLLKVSARPMAMRPRAFCASSRLSLRKA